MIENPRFIGNPNYPKTREAYEAVREELTGYLSKMLPLRPGESPITWSIHRIRFIERTGDESIATLLPEKVECSSSFMTRAVNSLHRCGIYKKEELINANIEELGVNKYKTGIGGEKTKEFAKLMQNLAVAEMYLDWNSH